MVGFKSLIYLVKEARNAPLDSSMGRSLQQSDGMLELARGSINEQSPITEPSGNL